MGTRHTGIPMVRFQGVYPPCLPSILIEADTLEICEGDTVTFSSTIECLAAEDIDSFYWSVDGLSVSTDDIGSFATDELLDGQSITLVIKTISNNYLSSNQLVVGYKPEEECGGEPIPVDINYGLLYNWYAATDERNITSSDEWKVPTYSYTEGDFKILFDYLGGTSVAGGKLKEIGFTRWNFPNTGANNETGFTGVGGGSRVAGGVFSSIKNTGWFLTSNIPYGVQMLNPALSYNYATVGASGGYKYTGINLRFLRDASESEQLQADGTECAPYIGNDGKIYRTVKIGTQVWLAENLAETKFRNGDYIHGYEGGVYTPISNEAWAAATEGMVCAYDDDLSNAYTE